MIEYENWCVDCDIPCIGSACLHSKSVYVTYCDDCDDLANCKVDGTDLCYGCARDRLIEIFRNDYTVEEMADMLKVNYERIDNK